MAYSIRFTRDQDAFPIARDGAYGWQVNDNWTPPSINPAYIIAEGSAFNAWGGGQVIGSGGNDVDFTVPLTVFGATYDHQINQVRRLASFVKQAKYFECKYSTLPTPKWGQHGAYMRYEIVTADVSTDDSLNNSNPPARRVYVQLRVKPRFFGAHQQPAYASGGVMEDTIGTGDGSSKGLRIPSATVNKMTNPVFSHATWDTGWTVGAGITASQNVDPAYCYPGAFVSARLVYAGGAATYYQGIAAGNTNKHAFSALIYYPGDTAPTSSDVVLYYNGDLTTTFRSLGNHIYLLYSDNVTGISASTATGLNFKRAAVSLYLMAYQMEEKVYHTPICHGDMLGCVWTGGGTRGAATTTRTAEQLAVYSTFPTTDNGMGGYEFVWVPDLDHTKSNSSYAHMIYTHTATHLQFYFNYSDAKWYLTDGTNTISSPAQTFAAGDRLHLVATWGPSGLVIYKNGVSIASGATFTPAATSALTYIGTDKTNYSGGVFASCSYYASEISSTQAAALYADAANETRAYSPIPWSKSISEGVRRLYIGTDSTAKNYIPVGGIAGNLPARTTYKAQVVNAVNAPDAFYMSILPIAYTDYLDVRDEWFYDLNGTADANCIGGGYTQYTTGNYPTGLSVRNTRIFPGRHNIFVRMKRSATTETVAITPRVFRGYQNIDGNPTNCAITTDYKIFHIGSVVFDASSTTQNPLWLRAYERFLLTAVFNATGTVYVDFVSDLPGEIVKFKSSDLAVDDYVVYERNRGVILSSGLDSGEIGIRGGDALDLYPDRITMLFGIIGENGDNPDKGGSLLVDIDFEPCWSLI